MRLKLWLSRSSYANDLDGQFDQTLEYLSAFVIDR
jgi:hypothetical protein